MALLPSVSFLGSNPAPTKGNEIFAVAYSRNSPMISQGFEVFKSKLKYRGFFFLFSEKGRKKEKPTQNPIKPKPPSSSRNKTNKGTEKKRVFSWRFFFFPSCFHILHSTLKTGTQDVKPWKQLDATGFLNYFCQGLDFGDFIFFLKFNWFFSPYWNP